MQKDRSILKIDKVLWKNTTTTTVNVERTYVWLEYNRVKYKNFLHKRE